MARTLSTTYNLSNPISTSLSAVQLRVYWSNSDYPTQTVYAALLITPSVDNYTWPAGTLYIGNKTVNSVRYPNNVILAKAGTLYRVTPEDGLSAPFSANSSYTIKYVTKTGTTYTLGTLTTGGLGVDCGKVSGSTDSKGSSHKQITVYANTQYGEPREGLSTSNMEFDRQAMVSRNPYTSSNILTNDAKVSPAAGSSGYSNHSSSDIESGWGSIHSYTSVTNSAAGYIGTAPPIVGCGKYYCAMIGYTSVGRAMDYFKYSGSTTAKPVYTYPAPLSSPSSDCSYSMLNNTATSTSAPKLKVTVKGAACDDSSNASSNKAKSVWRYRYRYRDTGTTSWGSWSTLYTMSSRVDADASVTYTTDELDYGKDYTFNFFQLTVPDTTDSDYSPLTYYGSTTPVTSAGVSSSYSVYCVIESTREAPVDGGISYVGVNNTAKKVKTTYVGVGNTAKKIKKVYIGVNNTAKEVK